MELEILSWPDHMWHAYIAPERPGRLDVDLRPICGAEVWWTPEPTDNIHKRVKCFRCLVESKARNAD